MSLLFFALIAMQESAIAAFEQQLQSQVCKAIEDRDFGKFATACAMLPSVDFPIGKRIDKNLFRGSNRGFDGFEVDHWTPLMVLCAGSAICGNDEICRERMVSLLLGLGADPNYTDQHGANCLNRTILLHRPLLTRMLLRSGASPIQDGLLTDHTIMLAVQCEPELVDDLVKSGVRVNIVQGHRNLGELAMRTASYAGLRRLVDSGFDIKLIDISESTGVASSSFRPKDPMKLREWARTLKWLRKRRSKLDSSPD